MRLGIITARSPSKQRLGASGRLQDNADPALCLAGTCPLTNIIITIYLIPATLSDSVAITTPQTHRQIDQTSLYSTQQSAEGSIGIEYLLET